MTMNPTSIGSAVRLTTATGETPAAPAAGLTPAAVMMTPSSTHRQRDTELVIVILRARHCQKKY